MDTLGKLFGSPARVKVMRLFLFNPEEVFEARDVRAKSKITAATATRELAQLRALGLIKQKNALKEVSRKRRGKTVVKRKKIRGWTLNQRFRYLEPIKNLLMSTRSFRRSTIINRFKNIGRVKLLIIAGIFLQDDRSRLDILVVGDYLKKNIIAHALKAIESEIGKELRYSVLGTNDFLYRVSVYDKFTRDILDYPHAKLVNKIGLK